MLRKGRQATSSSPDLSWLRGSGSGVERLLAKEKVEGSNPFSRSNVLKKRPALCGPFFFPERHQRPDQFLMSIPGWHLRQ